MSASGMRVANPTKIDATASARNAGSRTHVISSTTSATPIAAMIRSVAGSGGGTAGKLILAARFQDVPSHFSLRVGPHLHALSLGGAAHAALHSVASLGPQPLINLRLRN